MEDSLSPRRWRQFLGSQGSFGRLLAGKIIDDFPAVLIAIDVMKM
jgi:hypothetical protein